MARFLFTAVPALGHINPTLPLAVELKKRGHQVGYATGPDMQSSISSEGLRFFPAGPPSWNTERSELSQKTLKHKGTLLSNYYFFKVLAENDANTIGDLRSVVQQYEPDILVVDSLTYAGAQMAELFKLPWATCCAIAGLIPTRDAPPFTSWGLPPSDNPLVKPLYSVIRTGQNLFFRLFDREFNQIRSSLGLRPVKLCAIESTLSPYLILIPSSEGFEYRRSDWPHQAHLIGPSPWGKSIDGNNSFEWIDALPKDKPLIYVTLGTVQIFRSLDFFNTVIKALKDEPYQVVMGIGHGVDLSEFSHAPCNFRIEQFVPHAKILSQASAVIHHGGLGIAQDSIYHGLPSVVVPISQDHYESARRCSAAGVSITIPYSRLNPERLRITVRKVLSDKTIQESTKNLQAVFLNTNAGSTGATLLEKLAETKAPVYRTNTK